jgi:hypothetical protein
MARESRPAPAEAVAMMAGIAARLDYRGSVQLRIGDGAFSPFLAGLRRPVIVIPEAMLASAFAEDLPQALAHELAHLKGRDLAWMGALRALRIVLWWHPLAWRAGQAHATACERVCDAVASGVSGGDCYSRMLARVALELAGARPAFGLPLARPAQIRRRLEWLARGANAAPLSRRALAMAWLCGCLLAGACAVLRPVHAESSASIQAPAPAVAAKQPARNEAGAGAVSSASHAASPATAAKQAAKNGAAIYRVAQVRYKKAEDLIPALENAFNTADSERLVLKRGEERACLGLRVRLLRVDPRDQLGDKAQLEINDERNNGNFIQHAIHNQEMISLPSSFRRRLDKPEDFYAITAEEIHVAHGVTSDPGEGTASLVVSRRPGRKTKRAAIEIEAIASSNAIGLRSSDPKLIDKAINLIQEQDRRTIVLSAVMVKLSPEASRAWKRPQSAAADAWEAEIQALIRSGKAERVAGPRITVLDGQSAEFRIENKEMGGFLAIAIKTEITPGHLILARDTTLQWVEPAQPKPIRIKTVTDLRVRPGDSTAIGDDSIGPDGRRRFAVLTFSLVK